MSERVEEIRRIQKRHDDFVAQYSPGPDWEPCNQMSLDRGWLLAALAQAERERDEARAERNARARDVMHLEADLARVQEILTGACARYDHWYVNGASCEAGNMAYELVSAMRAAMAGRG